MCSKYQGDHLSKLEILQSHSDVLHMEYYWTLLFLDKCTGCLSMIETRHHIIEMILLPTQFHINCKGITFVRNPNSKAFTY